jgi:hypothetical protein
MRPCRAVRVRHEPLPAVNQRKQRVFDAATPAPKKLTASREQKHSKSEVKHRGLLGLGPLGAAGKTTSIVPKIFISYHHRDRSRAEALASVLEALEWRVYWDRKLEGGASFSKELLRQIRDSACVLVLWSRSALASKWVEAEALEAFNTSKLFSVLLHGVAPPFPFNTAHAVSLNLWRGRRDHAQLHALIESLSKFVGLMPQNESVQKSDTPRALQVPARMLQEYRKKLRSGSGLAHVSAKAIADGLPQAAVEAVLLCEYYEELARKIMRDALGFDVKRGRLTRASARPPQKRGGA